MLIAACSTVAHGLEQQRFEGLLHPRPISVGQLFTVHPWRQAGPDEHAAYILYLAYKQWTGGYFGQRIKPVLDPPGGGYGCNGSRRCCCWALSGCWHGAFPTDDGEFMSGSGDMTLP